MGQFFTKTLEQVPDESNPATPQTQSTPCNKLIKHLKLDPRSPTFGGFNRTPIRLTGDEDDQVVQQK